MSYKILVVDDSVLTRMAIKRTIALIDRVDIDEILEASNGIEALEVLDSHPIGMIFADLNMPEMGGIELVQRMKADKEHANIPVVVVSTESSMTRIKELLAEGIKDYLHKPFTPEEFRATLMKNLGVCNESD